MSARLCRNLLLRTAVQVEQRGLWFLVEIISVAVPSKLSSSKDRADMVLTAGSDERIEDLESRCGVRCLIVHSGSV